MKKTIIFFSIITLSLSFFSCNNKETYSDLQKKETNTINAYIKRNNIQVVEKIPSEWGENVYYLSPSGLYFHLIQEGDTATSISNWEKAKVFYRILEHELDENKTVLADHISSSNTSPDPSMILYGDLGYYSLVGQGMYEAIGLMKNNGSRAHIIVPSSLNTSSYSNNLIPICYEVVIVQMK